MTRLMFADVHACLPAFEAVLADAGHFDEALFFGDIVGYGAHPEECVALLQEIGARAILGNHDIEILADSGYGVPSGGAHDVWRRWTYGRLSARSLHYLWGLPRTIKVVVGARQATGVHGTSGRGYLHPAMLDDVFVSAFAEVPGDIVYFGHHHRRIEKSIGGRSLIGLKAVGQARDGDIRAGYAVERDGVIEHRVVAYDVEKAVWDVRGVGLPEPFLSRWVRFMRTGYDPEWSRDYSGE